MSHGTFLVAFHALVLSAALAGCATAESAPAAGDEAALTASDAAELRWIHDFVAVRRPGQPIASPLRTFSLRLDDAAHPEAGGTFRAGFAGGRSEVGSWTWREKPNETFAGLILDNTMGARREVQLDNAFSSHTVGVGGLDDIVVDGEPALVTMEPVIAGTCADAQCRTTEHCESVTADGVASPAFACVRNFEALVSRGE